MELTPIDYKLLDYINKHEPVDNNAPTNPPGIVLDTFDCCSQFRQCSDAGKCLITNQNHSLGCSYRKNLEAGKIFYGKNATNFSNSEYQKYCDTINSLTSPAQTEFLKILTYTHITQMGLISVIWDHSSALDEISDTKLCVVEQCAKALMPMYNLFAVNRILKEHPIYGELWKKAKAPQHTKKTGAQFFWKWIKENAKAFTDELACNFKMVTLNQDLRKYSNEYSYDYLRGKGDQIVTLPPLRRNDGGLFTLQRK